MGDKDGKNKGLDTLFDIAPWAVGGLFLGSALGLVTKFTKSKPTNYTSELAFNPTFFSIDPTCGNYFLRLQMWRHLSPECFDKAGIEADSVLGKVSGQRSNIEWLEEYERDANTSFRIMTNSLETFTIDCRLWLYDNLVKQVDDDLPKEQKENLLKRINHAKTELQHIRNLVKDIEARIKDHIFSLTSS